MVSWLHFGALHITTAATALGPEKGIMGDELRPARHGRAW